MMYQPILSAQRLTALPFADCITLFPVDHQLANKEIHLSALEATVYRLRLDSAASLLVFRFGYLSPLQCFPYGIHRHGSTIIPKTLSWILTQFSCQHKMSDYKTETRPSLAITTCHPEQILWYEHFEGGSHQRGSQSGKAFPLLGVQGTLTVGYVFLILVAVILF